jgi:hypothetical protein
MEELPEKCEKLLASIARMAVEYQRYEIAVWCRDVKKELAYGVVFNEDLTIEEFLGKCASKMKNLGKKDQDLIAPMLREFKLNILNI